jgi:aldehyde dehydrogenase (NAD+)
MKLTITVTPGVTVGPSPKYGGRMDRIISINPATGQELGSLTATTAAELDAVVIAARHAQPAWASMPIADRAAALHNVADEFVARRDEFGQLQSQEMGMPITAAVLNVERAAMFLRWYADNAEEGLASTTTLDQDGELHVVQRVARGVHGAIFPWNFPWSNMAWACGQSLVCGNAVVLKMSEEVPLSAAAFADVVVQHLPSGVFSLVQGDGRIGQALLAEPLDFVSFTGSTTTGRAVARAAAEQLIPSTLELGGSAAGIVCEDVDLDLVADKIALARLGNAGQRCDGLKRLLVHRSRFDQVVARLVDIFSSTPAGDPANPETVLGHLASRRQLDAVARQIKDAVDNGARALVGGEIDLGQVGAFCPATVLIDVTPDMRVWREEVFAPVLPIIAFDDDDQAVALANDSEYGLGAHVYTSDAARATAIANQLATGMVSVNGAIYTRPFNPFGGVKRSGYGREHGMWGYHELTVPKVVATAHVS